MTDDTINPHQPGVKLDKGKNRLGMVFGGFPNALEAIGDVGTYGASKYVANGWKDVPGGRERYLDAMLRHLLARMQGETYDRDSRLDHLAHVAWNALAVLELSLSVYNPENDNV